MIYSNLSHRSLCNTEPKTAHKVADKRTRTVGRSHAGRVITKINPSDPHPPNVAPIPLNHSRAKPLGNITKTCHDLLYNSHTPRPHWSQAVADLVTQYCPERHTPLIISLLPDHPLVVTIIELLRKGLRQRSIALLHRICRGRGKAGQELSALFLSPRALEILVDASLELKTLHLLPLIARELARTRSTQPTRDGPLARNLIVVHEKLTDTYYQLGDFQSVLSLYSASCKSQVYMDQIIFKRVIQSLFKRFFPSPTDQRRYSIPRSLPLPDGSLAPVNQQPNNHRPIDSVLEQLRRILNHMTSENVVPSSRLLADIFRGLGTILKLETQGIETDFDRSGNQTETHKTLGIPAPQGSTPAFRLEKLILDETTWSTVGRIVNNILGQTMDPNSFRQPGDEGRMMLLMTWADVMLSLREDVADAIVRATGSRSTLKALSSRIDELLSTNQAWNYQRTFDRLARTSSLRPHHENSFGEIGSESDPALDLPVGPAPGEWPISRTLNEAQRISLLVRDRLVEGDSVAALLHFHSLASLCGAFRRLCDATSPADAPSLLVHSSGDDYQRPQEVVLAEARQELEVRVESVYVRLAGHALRTGDSNYVNDVLELAYTLPPRDNKRTFSRVWKRAMSAFVRWRTEWSGSGGIGRAFRTLAHLLGIKFASSKGRQNKNAISEAIPRAITDPSRELFDLGWLREKKSWPDLGRNVFARHYVVSALIEEAEKTTSVHFRTGSTPNAKAATKHLQDVQRLSEEAKVRKTIRRETGNRPRSLPRSMDICPRGEEPGMHAREEATNVCGESGDHTHLGSRTALKTPMYSPQGGATPIAMLVGVLGALKVPMAVGEAEKLGYSGPRHESNTIQKTVTDSTRK